MRTCLHDVLEDKDEALRGFFAWLGEPRIAAAKVADELRAPANLARGVPSRPAPGAKGAVDLLDQIVHAREFPIFGAC